MAPSLRVDFDQLLEEFSSSFDSTCNARIGSSSTLPNNNNNNNNNSNKRGRSVAFSKTVKIHSVPSRKHLSKQEMESLYMSRQDLWAIKRGLIFRLQQQERQTTNDNNNTDDTINSDNDDDTLRGLEHCGPKTSVERRRRIDSAIQSVLKQKELGHDDEFISQLYGKFVRQSAWTAHLRGLQDEQESPYQSSPKHRAMVRS
jgi:hypothetical protein